MFRDSHNVGGGEDGPAIVFRQRWLILAIIGIWRCWVEQSGYGGQLLFYTNHGTSVADDIVMKE